MKNEEAPKQPRKIKQKIKDFYQPHLESWVGSLCAVSFLSLFIIAVDKKLTIKDFFLVSGAILGGLLGVFLTIGFIIFLFVKGLKLLDSDKKILTYCGFIMMSSGVIAILAVIILIGIYAPDTGYDPDCAGIPSRYC